MIFVTLGSQKFTFNRLLKKIDELIDNGIIQEEVFVQSGYSDYSPKNYEFESFLDREKFLEIMSGARIIITHAGTGAIVSALKQGKKVVAIPRRKKYGEHVDDHQLQIMRQFEEMNLIEACYEINDLENAYKNINKKKYEVYQSNTQKIIASISTYLETNFDKDRFI